MRALLLVLLLSGTAHGFWNKYYDALEFKTSGLRRYRRSDESEGQPAISDGTQSQPHIAVADNGEIVPAEDTNTTHEDGEAHADHVHVASWNFDYVERPIIVCLFLIIVAICKLGFHHAHFLSSIIPESCMLIILGVVVGGIFYATNLSTGFTKLEPRMFFLFILPPIILESAYSLHDRTFMDNLGTIIIYAVLGTLANCFIIGPVLYGLAEAGLMGSLSISMVECLVFSSLIVAVDPVAVLAIFQEVGVNNVLYFLVFGESLLNDAVTVVIYNMMKTFYLMETIPLSEIGLGVAAFLTVSLGGLSIGIIFGVLTAIMTKYTQHVRVVEPLGVIILAYMSYLGAEMFHFSGIISIIGCGLVQAHYAFHNIGYKSQITVKYFIKMLSGSMDCIIFLLLGLAMVSDRHVWNAWFILWSIILCFVTRFMVVYSFTAVANSVYRMRKINLEEQFIMAYGGLRGAVSFSLVNLMDSNLFEKRDLFETTTLMVIVFTVFVQGITIKPLVSLLRITKKGETTKNSILNEINFHVNDHMMAGIEEIIGHRGRNALRELLDFYDNRFFKNWFQRDPQGKDDVIIEAYKTIEMNLHYQSLAEAQGKRGVSNWYTSNETCNRVSALADIMIEAQKKRKSQLQRTSESSVTSDDSNRWKQALGLIRRNRLSTTTSQEEHNEESDRENIRRYMKRQDNFRQRYDRNLTNEDQHDLWHRLYEKKRRESRIRDSMLSSPSGSTQNLRGSLPGLPGLGEPSSRPMSHHISPTIPEDIPMLDGNILRQRSTSGPPAAFNTTQTTGGPHSPEHTLVNMPEHLRTSVDRASECESAL